MHPTGFLLMDVIILFFCMKLSLRKKKTPALIPPSDSQKDTRFLLCIDGGGMRGIIPVMVLLHLSELLKEKSFSGNMISLFDMISGTSTGGLIALALSCQNKLNLKDLSDAYMSLGDEIFPEKPSGIRKFKLISEDKYPPEGINNVLSRWFGDAKMSEAAVRTFVVSYDLTIGREGIFKSWEGPDVLVREAGRATSAAPTYFPPQMINGHMYADGAVIANNSSLFALSEAKKLWPECKNFMILSLGTGFSPHIIPPEGASGIIQWLEKIVPMYSTAQRRFIDYLMEREREVSYIRIDKALDPPVSMDDHSFESMHRMRDFGIRLADNFNSTLSLFSKYLLTGGKYYAS